jgi:hypothetical protein
MKTAGALLLLMLTTAPAFPQAPAEQAGGTQTTPVATGQTTTPQGTQPNPQAAAPGTPDLSLPKDMDASWLIGFSVFSGEGLSTENAYLCYSLPLLLLDSASGLAVHALSDEERNLVARAAIDRERATADAAITVVRRDRGALAFSDSPVTDAARAAAEARVTAARARRDFLAALEPAEVQVAASKPIKVKEGTGAGKLLDLPSVPPDVYCARQGIEMLVGGSLREFQGYLLLDVWAYDATWGKMVFTYRNAAQRDELYASVGSLGRELASRILGRPWSLVIFSPDPKRAALYVDGILVVTGSSPALYLPPGLHEVTISAPGYAEVTRAVTFDEGAETRIEDVLQKNAAGTIEVTTVPAGADFYLDSVWKGRTPFTIEAPALRSRGVLSLDGYYDQSFSLSPVSPAALSFSLELDIGSKDAAQKQARDEFYTSFAWFALSIPLPLFSIAFQYDYAPYAPVPAWIFTGTYYAGIAVSVALFSWMVSRIIRYVGVSNGTAG